MKQFWSAIRQLSRKLLNSESKQNASEFSPKIGEQSSAPVFDNVERVFEIHRQGRLIEAERMYKDLLITHPGRADILHLFGVLQAQCGNFNAAKDLIGRAIELNPGDAAIHSNQGNVFRELKQYDYALLSYDKSIELNPRDVDTLSNRGVLLGELSRHLDAMASYDQALVVNPSHFGTYYNRSISLKGLKRYTEALYSYEKALELKPDSAEAFNGRGTVLEDLGRHDEALASYDEAIALNPSYAEAIFNRGGALRVLGRTNEAIASYDKALIFKPNYVEALNDRGIALMHMGHHEEARASYEAALQIDRNYIKALDNLGSQLRILGRHEESIACFERLLEIDPDADYALGNKLTSDMQVCQWSQYAEIVAELAHQAGRGKLASAPFSMLYLSSSASDQLHNCKAYAALNHPSLARPVWSGEQYYHQRIRLAYLSGDLHDHAISYLMARLFELHDRSKFEIFAMSFGPDRKSDMRDRIQKAFEHFINVHGKSDGEIADMMKELEIDIAVDLMALTLGSRPGIFARRAVPVQINYLGYPGTMGAPYMDYIIGDAEVIPAGEEVHYVEKVVRLPDSYQANDARREISPRIFTRAEAGLPKTGFVFCCFNNNYKITPDIFDMWMRLLKRVEGSVFWLFEDNPTAARNLRKEAQARSVDAGRLIFAPRLPLAEHLARHKLANLFLDTLPYNAHTTASDSLWAGLPLVTCMGHAFPGRVAASLLRAAGLPELITHNFGDYEALALQLATNPDKLQALKIKLEQNRGTCALFNSDRFRRHIEAAYIIMHERQQRGQPPEAFEVAPQI